MAEHMSYKGRIVEIFGWTPAGTAVPTLPADCEGERRRLRIRRWHRDGMDRPRLGGLPLEGLRGLESGRVVVATALAVGVAGRGFCVMHRGQIVILVGLFSVAALAVRSTDRRLRRHFVDFVPCAIGERFGLGLTIVGRPMQSLPDAGFVAVAGPLVAGLVVGLALVGHLSGLPVITGA